MATVNTPTSRKKDWVLTPEAFELLLARLDPDRERAGEKYEAVRAKLVKFFGWWGSERPEEHADQTLDRVGRRLHEGERVENINHYVVGVARLVFKEYQKDQVRERAAFERMPRDPAPPEDAAAREARHACYEECLRALPEESRETLLQYYQEGRRKNGARREEMSRQKGIPLGRLRVHAFRIRNRLASCLRACLERYSRRV